MNTNKSFAYGISAVLIALAFIACDNGNNDPTHTHSYSTEWSHNATQHWHECTANDGAKTDIANHTGDPCTVCEYTASVNQPPTANAGTDQTHTLSNDLTITLDGTDSAGNITAYAWQCETYTANQGAVSAEYTPAQVNALIANANTATATVAPRKAGTYVFKLTVTDNDGGSDTDNVTVVVEGYTVQKDVTVGFPAFSSGTSVSFTPNYFPDGDWGEYFSASDITYTLMDTLDHTWYSETGFTVNISDGPYENSTTYLFTQIFTMNDMEISQDIRVRVLLGRFASLRDTSDVALDPQAIPSIPLHLEKTITEIPPVTAHAHAAPTHTQ